jgi:DNA replication licensing factor MCM5
MQAGITTTLNSRCSVLAAANSVFGRWDDTKGEENIDFMPTILSRFDMIFIVKDIHDEARDTVSNTEYKKIQIYLLKIWQYG